jgi:hypothetical protein
MTTMTTEAVTAPRTAKADNGAEKTPTRTRRSRTSSDDESDRNARYFLATTSGTGGVPALDREVANEGEALVEALRLGVTFYAVQEFRAVPDFSGRKPQLNKEAVKGR